MEFFVFGGLTASSPLMRFTCFVMESVRFSMSKSDRVREIIKNHLGKITKSEIMEKCPDISQITVQRALADLIKSGEILKIGGGRYTSYTWNRERE